MIHLFATALALELAQTHRWQASDDAAVVVNGRRIHDVALIRDNRVQVPLRAVAEALGGTAQWYPETHTVVIHKGRDEVSLLMNQNFGYGEHRAQYLDFPPRIIRGRIMVPLRYVSEELGAKVRWDRSSRTAFIRLKDHS